MNEKAIINMKDEIHYIYFELEKTNNMLHIFSEFVEDERFISASTDNEDKQWMSICFTNRLPMFYTLLETVIEKNTELQEKLEKLNQSFHHTIKENTDDANNN